MVLPSVAKELNLKTSFSGGWLVDYADKLSRDPDIELATMTYANIPCDMDETVCGIRNFIFAGGGKRLLLDNKQTIKDCQKVIDEFKPDVIHIHGTEYAIGNSMLKTKTNIPTVLTIQGIISRISEEYFGGISFRQILAMGNFKEYLKFKTPLFSKMLYYKNAKREKFVLNNVKYVTGRTFWDETFMLSQNPELKYYRLNYNLNELFYEADRWDYNKINKYTIYTGASTYPLKGLHNLIKAIPIVKAKYPEVKLLVPVNRNNIKKANGYERYILKLIDKLGLQSNVEFIGQKNAKEVSEILSKAHICVIPSAIEGASATMREAMMIGTPGICAYRGGMTDLLKDGESGFYYDFSEYPILAGRIVQMFEDKDLCEKFSKNVRQKAELMHDREKNYHKLKSIYDEVINKNTHD